MCILYGGRIGINISSRFFFCLERPPAGNLYIFIIYPMRGFHNCPVASDSTVFSKIMTSTSPDDVVHLPATPSLSKDSALDKDSTNKETPKLTPLPLDHAAEASKEADSTEGGVGSPSRSSSRSPTKNPKNYVFNGSLCQYDVIFLCHFFSDFHSVKERGWKVMCGNGTRGD